MESLKDSVAPSLKSVSMTPFLGHIEAFEKTLPFSHLETRPSEMFVKVGQTHDMELCLTGLAPPAGFLSGESMGIGPPKKSL